MRGGRPEDERELPILHRDGRWCEPLPRGYGRMWTIQRATCGKQLAAALERGQEDRSSFSPLREPLTIFPCRLKQRNS